MALRPEWVTNPYNDTLWSSSLENVMTLKDDWNHYDSYESYVGQPVPRQGECAIEMELGPIIVRFSRKEFKNLMSHSTYYKSIVNFEELEIMDEMIVRVTHPIGLERGLCVYLIVLNSMDVPVLPSFEKTNVQSFVEICSYYGFNTMLDQMVQFCVDTGLHFLPQCLEALINEFGVSDYRVLHLSELFQALWDTHQHDRISGFLGFGDSLALVLPEQLISCGALPALVRSLIQSPALRCRPLFPVCGICELPVHPHQRIQLTHCCAEMVHEECLWATARQCEICIHSQHRFVYGMMHCTVADMLSDFKYKNWFRCQVHAKCLVFYKDKWNTITHRSVSAIKKTMRFDADHFKKWMYKFYEKESSYTAHFG